MNVQIANAMGGYLKTLYSLNQRLIKLCGIDVFYENGNGKNEVLDIIQDIPRLIPYESKDNKLKLANNDGLLEFKEKIPYLEEEYEKILSNNYCFLDKVRQVRNKYEHKMHDIKTPESGSGADILFEYKFNVREKTIKMNSYEFIKLVKNLNNLFSLIVKNIDKYAYDNGKENYAYYRRITSFNFNDFNKLYESDLLRIIGRIMRNY